jgi:hypothetical protein
MFFRHNNKQFSTLASMLCCPDNQYPHDDFTQGFGIEKGISIKNPQSAVLGLSHDGGIMVKALQELNAENISKIKNVINGSLDSRQQHFEDHDYSPPDTHSQMDDTTLFIALDGLSFYDIYNGLQDLGYARFLSRSNLPNSIGIGNVPFRKVSDTRVREQCIEQDSGYVNQVLHGHLEAFNLQHVPIPGDEIVFSPLFLFICLPCCPQTRYLNPY